MISCIFTTAFYAIVIFVDAITTITTIISNLQTNFFIMPRALYRVFQIVERGRGISPLPPGTFLSGGENLRGNDFEDSKFFQIEKSIL